MLPGQRSSVFCAKQFLENYRRPITFHLNFVCSTILLPKITTALTNLTNLSEGANTTPFTSYSVMGTHSFIRYIVTVTVTLLVTTVTNEHLQ
jgi:hypothetical protein